MKGFGECSTCKSFAKSVFSCLGTEIATKLVTANSVSISYKKGQDIYSENTVSKGVYCIQHGKAELYKKCAERNITYKLLGDSDFVGYQDLINGQSFTNSAKCLADSQVCFIPKKTFFNILDSNPDITSLLLKNSCDENKKLTDFARDLKCKNTLNRIIKTIVIILEKFGLDEDKCLDLEITRKDLSEIAGTTTESAIRVLNDLKREKIISFYNNRLRIDDINKLLKYL